MYYLIVLLVYGAVDVIACLALSYQFGVAGVTNFGLIIFQAAGAYVAAILSLSPDTANGGFQRYIGGWNLPFPVPWLGAAAAGALLALPFTFLVGRRLRGDFAAIGLLVTAVLANLLVTNYVPLFNGDAGVAIVPAPLQSNVFTTTSNAYQFGYAAGVIVLAAGVYWFVRRVTESPYGRTLRAMRDNDRVADSLGKNLFSLRTGSLILGGALAGLSGGLLVSFISVWSPPAWTYAETIVLFAAVIIGGAGNHAGAVLGAVLVPVGFEEITRFITSANPNLPPNLLPSLQWVAIGLLITVFLWFRPEGVLPERKRVIALPALPAADPAAPLARAAAHDDQPRTHRAGTPGARRDRPRPGGDVLQAVGLGRDFGGVHAVANVSFSIRARTLTGLIGPNGAGKSTLMALLAGTERPSAGQVIYQGDDITAAPAFRRAQMGLVRTFQLASEFKRLTVMENLLSAAPGNRGDSFRGAVAGRRYWGRDEAASVARAADILRRFGLDSRANDHAGKLSGGQRRLVEIMRALMAEPDMLLLDEPMAGVHPTLRLTIEEHLKRLRDSGLTMLMVEHELGSVERVCDSVIVMAQGKLLAAGTMSELRRNEEVLSAYLAG
jgi:ABC-type branched-subunit amino acid transport system ATPase component/ABC-type branched-subunit amino acid transport system permease subunit